MKYSLVIFDLDGTTLNTLEDLCDSTNFALTGKGFKMRQLDEIRAFVGNGIKRLIERSVPDGTSVEDTDECLNIFREHYSINMKNKTRPYDGVIELIKNIRRKGFMTAVVSNKSEYAVIELCNETFPELFDMIIGQVDGRAAKPAPDGILCVLDKLKVSKEKAVFVGDSEVDVQTAKNAGLDCAGVTWGFRDRNILEKYGAKYIVNNTSELFDLLCL